MKDTILKFEKVYKYFESRANPLFGGSFRVTALDGVSFSVKRGATTGIVGESGSGKSTAAKIILGLEAPSSGRALYKGKSIEELLKEPKERRSFRQEVQMVFQDPVSTLNPKLSIYDVLKEPIELHSTAQGNSTEERARQLLKDVELDESALYSYPHEFSGGQRQRVGIARALAVNPGLIVLDEPVSALDISVQSQILNLLLELKERLGLTYLFISHDLSVINYLCSDIIVMYAGKVMEYGSREDVFERTAHPYTELLLASSFTISRNRSRRTDEAAPPPDTSSDCPFYPRCPKRTQACLSHISYTRVSETHASYCVNNR